MSACNYVIDEQLVSNTHLSPTNIFALCARSIRQHETKRGDTFLPCFPAVKAPGNFHQIQRGAALIPLYIPAGRRIPRAQPLLRSSFFGADIPSRKKSPALQASAHQQALYALILLNLKVSLGLFFIVEISTWTCDPSTVVWGMLFLT